MMWGSGGWFGGMMWMVLFWALLVAGTVWLVRTTANAAGRGQARVDDRYSARAILDERFAAGELSVAEYRARRDAVEDGR